MKNSYKTDRRRLFNLSMRVIVALVMVGLLVIPVAVQADLKATAVVYAWDIIAAKFQNSNVIIPWDGTWIPFLHQVNIDTDMWADPGVCGYDPARLQAEFFEAREIPQVQYSEFLGQERKMQ